MFASVKREFPSKKLSIHLDGAVSTEGHTTLVMPAWMMADEQLEHGGNVV